MELIEQLSAEELDAIRAYIRSYGAAEGESLHTNVDVAHILRFWNREKDHLYKAFGEQFILTRHISFRKNQEEMENDMYDKLMATGSPGHRFYTAYETWSNQFWNVDRDTYYQLRDLTNCRTLIPNVYSGPSFSLLTPDKKILAIHAGCKASKILGKIATAFNLEGFEEFRIAHSQCLNQKTTEGDVCLSIHPLDYMTMSDNDCGWDSCMSWQGGGEYRQGTVEMMNSPCVVVAYLKSKSDMDLFQYFGNSFRWSNKKWRQLYIVHPDVIMSVRQYPYESDDLDTFCLKWLRELVDGRAEFSTYHPQMCRIKNHYEMPLAFLDRTVHFSFQTCFMYNDVYLEHNAFVNVEIPERVYINYSGATECVSCGAAIDEDPEDGAIPTSSLLCCECGDFMRCDECGRSMDPDDYYWLDDSRLCEHCYENYASYCAWCEDSHYTYNMTKVYLRHRGDYVHGHYFTICDSCMNSNNFRADVGKVAFDERNCRYCLDTDKLTDMGWELFDIYGDERKLYIDSAKTE